MNLDEVQKWALAEGIPESVVICFRDAALLTAISRLLQAAYREQYGTRSSLERDISGQWFLVIGRAGELRMPVKRPFWHQRFEAAGFPEIIDEAGDWHRVTTRDAFVEALQSAWREDGRIPFDRLTADFDNSFANLVLNQLLFHVRPLNSAMEPAFDGHNSYPFPALRIGPTLQQIVSCSNLSDQPVDLPLAILNGYSFVSTEHGDDERFFRTWSGSAAGHWQPGMVALHPWQLALSPVLHSARRTGMLQVLPYCLSAMPLASQRTCRILTTGYDVKLPVDATLTGERRLLYGMNTLNAPVVSTLVRILRAADGPDTLEFQYDEASFTVPDEHAGRHLAAIIRRPPPESPGAVLVPALLLWAGQRLADSLLRIGDKDSAIEVFLAYCRILFRGPVEFYARWGLAFEPHLQNALIRIEDGWPTGIVLRDLDGTILDPVRVPGLLRKHGLRLPVESWGSMPDSLSGARRLMHGLVYAHLSQVVLHLVEHADLDIETLENSIDQIWRELSRETYSQLPRRVAELRAESWTVKELLRTRMDRSMVLSFRNGG